MFFGKKFIREKFTESILRRDRRSDFDARNAKNDTRKYNNIIIVSAILFLSFLVTMICFCGQDLVWVQFVPNSKARMQIVADIQFDYFSKIKTKRLKEQRRNLVAPIYKIDKSVYEDFEKEIHNLDEMLDAFSDQSKSTEAYVFELKNFVRNFNDKHEMNISWSDADVLIRKTDEYDRTGILLEGLTIVNNILHDGIFDQSLEVQKGEEYFLNIEVEGTSRRAHNRSEDDAVRFFKLRLFSVEAPSDVLQSVFRILKEGIKSNIKFDSIATSMKITKILQETPDVIDKIRKGEVIIDAGSIVTEDDYEKLLAYKEALQDSNISLIHSKNHLFERFLVSFAVLLLMYIFLTMSGSKFNKIKQKDFLLVATLLLFNLLIFRFFLWLFELKVFDFFTAFSPANTNELNVADATEAEESANAVISIFRDPIYLLPYIMPLTLACTMGALLLRTYVGILLGIVISIFNCLMLSQSLEFLILSVVIVFISVYFVKNSYIRTQVIRSGNFSGMAFSLVALILSIGMKLPNEIIFFQVILAFFNCFFVSMIILPILPFFENLFQCCTNIYLIELTDYSNPLLMKLQILAPGTYHHSLMVANLSERAAVSINANPFLCRTLALYHDIGKMTKPEYFTENQSGSKNPHDEKTPFMSSLIIKSHVKKGISIAKSVGLPQSVIDGIIEHHGTTVIRYFYSKALKQQEESQISSDGISFASIEIEKSAFRYDGPRPRSKETLILSIADSIEAASRSMYNPTPQSIQTLTNKIIDGKIAENQFDECPITFDEVDELRKSFYFTLLNMMHSRINYDEVKS